MQIQIKKYTAVENAIPEKLLYIESSEMHWVAVEQAFASDVKIAMWPGHLDKGGQRWWETECRDNNKGKLTP